MSAELITELVKRYSPSEQESDAVRYLVDWMKKNGFESSVDTVGNAVGWRGDPDASHTLMLLGHIDTVRGEIPVRVEDGILYGRGSVDAKGPLCAFAAAAAQAVIPEGWQVVVVGAVEEEVTSSKGARHIAKAYTPDLCIIGEPSSADRITLGYKGRLMVEYTYTRTVSHTAHPEPSAGAMGVEFWKLVQEWAAQENENHERYFDQIMPTLQSINTSSDGFNEAVTMMIGFRLPPRRGPEEVVAVVSRFAAPNSELRAYGAEKAFQSDKNTLLVRNMLAAIRAQGERPGFVYKTGTSDMNIVGVVWNCPIIAYGPGDSRLDHTPNEHLSLVEYEQAVAVLRYFIEHLSY
jgi:LysW-gamma-L-lysine carboxypeptidase